VQKNYFKHISKITQQKIFKTTGKLNVLFLEHDQSSQKIPKLIHAFVEYYNKKCIKISNHLDD